MPMRSSAIPTRYRSCTEQKAAIISSPWCSNALPNVLMPSMMLPPSHKGDAEQYHRLEGYAAEAGDGAFVYLTFVNLVKNGYACRR